VKAQSVTRLNKVVVTALEDIKAHDIVSFDVTHLTSLFDRVVIASADSGRQLRALSRNVQDKVREAGGHIVNVEGEDGDEWVLVDTGDVIVHIMQPATRMHYNLEELWGVPKPKAPRKTAKKTATHAEA
jgi:ribosome-associated protein